MKSLLCPLCLKELTPGTQLLRFCGVHQELDYSNCVELTPNNPSVIFCPGHYDCNSSGSVARSPVLVHLDCQMLNPFIQQDGTMADRLEYTNSDSVQVQVDSWEFEVSKKLYARFPQVKAMFFPQALFRALNEQTENEKLAASMLLLGEQGVGKSVLATMAIRRGVWNARRPESGGMLRGDSFVYVSPAEHAAERHGLEADHLRAAIDDQSPRVRSTEARLRNIRSLFLRVSNVNGQANSSSPEIGEMKWFANMIQKLLVRPNLLRKGVPPQSSVLVLYDVAGEQARRIWDENIAQLLQRADRFAILIDATELRCFGGSPSGPTNSLRVAKNWLAQLDQKPRCLVVTKIDRVRKLSLASQDRYLKQSWDEWRGAINDDSVRDYWPSQSVESELLAKLLTNSKSGYERDIHREITGANACPVYFVWTEGIDSATASDPIPVGLHRFVQDWCFHGISIVAY